MQTRRLVIGGSSYILEPGGASDRVRPDIEAAARAGGAFVDVPLMGGGSVAVLVTAHTRALLEPYEFEPHDPSSAAEIDAGYLDYDFR